MSTNILPGDRLGIDGADRIVTSAVPATHRGRHSILVAHVDPSDVRDGYAFSSDATVTRFPAVRPLSARPYGRGVGMSPGEVAAGAAMRSRALTGRPAIDASARAEYVAARERGETVPAALSRARSELVAFLVLSYDYEDTGAPWSDALDTYDVDPGELYRVTSDPRTATFAGAVRDAETGALILAPVTLPDGATARVYVYADDDHGAPEDECYTDEDREAWREDRWLYVGVTAVVTLADGARGEASLWGVEMGDYWRGSDASQIWHAIPDLVREAAGEAADAEPDPGNIPEDDRATCGECHRSWNARTLPTPADRCPWEHEHAPESDETPAVDLAARVRAVLDELDAERDDEPAEGYDQGFAMGLDEAVDRIREVLDAEGSR